MTVLRFTFKLLAMALKGIFNTILLPFGLIFDIIRVAEEAEFEGSGR